MNDTQTLIGVAEVGKRLGLPPRTVTRLARAGELPSVRLGERTLRFDPNDVEAFIASRKTEAAS